MQGLFDVTGKVAVVTGGGGILCSEMARALAENGAKVAVVDLFAAKAEEIASAIRDNKGEAIGVEGNVLERASLERACAAITKKYGRIDILVNGAGGNKKDATADESLPFFDIPQEALQWVFNLNLAGTFLASQVFGSVMAQQKSGTIINISSMCSYRPLTKVVAYSAAKAAVNNFTQWLAVHLNRHCSPDIRVNAIAPGFFVTEQNRFLLVDEKTGESTPRGRQIVDHTPMARYGTPDELIGTLIWLVSDASRFVNGIVVPVDGGFSAFSGV